jgi:hypothetical protein
MFVRNAAHLPRRDHGPRLPRDRPRRDPSRLHRCRASPPDDPPQRIRLSGPRVPPLEVRGSPG